jgi:hypothetical protein
MPKSCRFSGKRASVHAAARTDPALNPINSQLPTTVRNTRRAIAASCGIPHPLVSGSRAAQMALFSSYRHDKRQRSVLDDDAAMPTPLQDLNFRETPYLPVLRLNLWH